jgi:putative ABC transport system permease protein
VGVLGYTVAEDLFPGENPIGKVVKVGQVPLEVIGVLQKKGTVAFQNQDDQVYIPLPIAQQQLLGIRYLQGVRAKVDTAENVKAVIADVQQLLLDRHNIADADNADFSVRDLADAVKLLTTITNALRAFLALMAAIALVVGGIGIMNIMLVTVAERTREIGLRKAVGATSRQVRDQFLVESSVLTGLGGVMGVALGSLLSYGAALAARSQDYTWEFSISILSVALAIGVSVLTGIVFGLYPARKASKLEPVEALRYE